MISVFSGLAPLLVGLSLWSGDPSPARWAIPAGEDGAPRTGLELPWGLLQWALDPVTLDPRDGDFDLWSVVDAGYTTPWPLRLGHTPSPGDGLDLTLRGSELLADLGDRRGKLEDRGFTDGGTQRLFSVATHTDLGRGYGVVHWAMLEGFAVQRLDFRPEEGFVAALDGDSSFAVGQWAGARGEAAAAAGLATALSWAREFRFSPRRRYEGGDWQERWWERRARQPRLYVGATLRRYAGLASSTLDADAGLRGLPPVAADPRAHLEFGYDAYHRSNVPQGLTNLGGGWGVDLGAIFRFRRFELHASVHDLFAALRFDRARVDHFVLDAPSGASTRTTEDFRAEDEVDLPTRARVGLALRPDDRTRLDVDLESFDGAWAGTLEGWYDWNARWSWGGSVGRDRRARAQGGVSLRWWNGEWGLAMGVRTHARNLTRARQIEVSIGLLGWP